MSRKPAELVPLMTRLPEELRGKLALAAEKSGRSMNMEIIERLKLSFHRDEIEAIKKARKGK